MVERVFVDSFLAARWRYPASFLQVAQDEEDCESQDGQASCSCTYTDGDCRVSRVGFFIASFVLDSFTVIFRAFVCRIVLKKWAGLI